MLSLILPLFLRRAGASLIGAWLLPLFLVRGSHADVIYKDVSVYVSGAASPFVANRAPVFPTLSAYTLPP